MKYIIDIDDEPFTRKSSGENLYMTSNTTVVFDQIEIDNLTPYDESAAEQRGREEAWELFAKLDTMSSNEWMECFENKYIPGRLGDMSYAEVKAKYDAWQKRKNEIKVGDEVSYVGNVFVVTRISDPEIISGIGKNGETFSMKDKKKWHKTGRSFPIVDLLEKMREPS